MICMIADTLPQHQYVQRCADELATNLEPRLRYFLTHAQPRRRGIKGAEGAAATVSSGDTRGGAQSNDAAKARPAGHLYLGSLCSAKSGAQSFTPPPTAPLDFPAWESRHADACAIAYCRQCTAHINEEYLVRCMHLAAPHTGSRACWLCPLCVCVCCHGLRTPLQQAQVCAMLALSPCVFTHNASMLCKQHGHDAERRAWLRWQGPTRGTHVQEAGCRELIALIQRSGVPTADQPEHAATAAANLDTPLAKALSEAMPVIASAPDVESLVICSKSALPPSGLEHFLVYVHTGHGSVPSVLGGSDAVAAPQDDDTPARADMVIGHVGRVVPIDAAGAEAVASSKWSHALQGARIDCSHVALLLNVPLTSAWLASGCGGSGAGQQVFLTPLLFVLPHKSAFECALTLARDVRQGTIHAPRRALLDTVVSGVPPDQFVAFDSRLAHASAQRGQRAAGRDVDPRQQVQPDVPHREWHEYDLQQSEEILGHACNADQRSAVQGLQAGVFAIHGPPGTGAQHSGLCGGHSTALGSGATCVACAQTMRAAARTVLILATCMATI